MSLAGYIVFAILCYGSMLLSPICLIGLALCGVGMAAGKWDLRGFTERWGRCKKMVIGFSIPPIVFLLSMAWLEGQRSFPNGYKLVYMNSDACYLVHKPSSAVVIGEHIVEKSIARSGNQISGHLANGKTFTLNTSTGIINYQSPGQRPVNETTRE